MEILTVPEWLIMDALWEKHPLVLSEVIASVGDELDWDPKTYSTYMARLKKKGFVGSKTMPGRAGRAYAFYPLVTKEECIGNESKNMQRKIKDTGTAMLFFAHMIEDTKLDKKSADELVNLIDTLLEEQKKREGK